MATRVYVAGPYTQGDVELNIRTAYEAADRLANLGFAPFVPHGNHYWHVLFPRPYGFWLELGCQFIGSCQAVPRLPGPSQGADHEVAVARESGVPVFYDLETLDAFFRAQRAGQGGGT